MRDDGWSWEKWLRNYGKFGVRHLPLESTQNGPLLASHTRGYAGRKLDGANFVCVIFWEIFCALWSRLTAAGMQMPECEHLNPHLFDASDHTIYRTRKAQNNFPNH